MLLLEFSPMSNEDATFPSAMCRVNGSVSQCIVGLSPSFLKEEKLWGTACRNWLIYTSSWTFRTIRLTCLLPSSGQPWKKWHFLSSEFGDGVAPHHHGNCSFRHHSPGVLCNTCPCSLVLHTVTFVTISAPVHDRDNRCHCGWEAALIRRFQFCSLSVAASLFAISLTDT